MSQPNISPTPRPRDRISQAYLGMWGSEYTVDKTRRRIDWIVSQVNGENVLDVGCSEGILPILLGRRDLDVLGVDINLDALLYAKELLDQESIGTRNRVQFLCHDFLELDLGSKKYDTVILGEIIEHFYEPRRIILKAQQFIQPQGKVIITTPFGYFPDPDHKTTFTISTFIHMVEGILTPISLDVVDGYIRFVARPYSGAEDLSIWQAYKNRLLELAENFSLEDQKRYHHLLLEVTKKYQAAQKETNALAKEHSHDTQIIKKLSHVEEENRELTGRIKKLETSLAVLREDLLKKEQFFTAEVEKNRQLTSRLQSLNSQYQVVSSRLKIIQNSIIYRISKEIRDGLRQPSKKTLMLPLTISRLFYQGVKKRLKKHSKVQQVLTLVRQEPALVLEYIQTQEKSFQDALGKFMDLVISKPDSPVIVISTTTKRMGGLKRLNRTMAFAAQLAELQIPVIYVYYRWRAADDINSDYDGTHLLQLPNDFFHKHAEQIARSIPNADKLFLISIPDVNSTNQLSLFRLFEWKVAYEVRDDWEEFQRVGSGNWYNLEFEKYICSKADFITAVSIKLKEKMISLGAPETRTCVVPNGLSDYFYRQSRTVYEKRKNGIKGQGIIGYFGHLTDKWFDWDLLIRTGYQRPDLQFEIIGFGAPDNLRLPKNIRLLGEKSHDEIIQISANWDLAIIPFKNSDLARAVDPIKIYEYLALGLPCVSCFMDQIVDYPLTSIYYKAEDFTSTLDKALQYQPADQDWSRIDEFLTNNSWKNRVLRTLSIAGIDTEPWIVKKSSQ